MSSQNKAQTVLRVPPETRLLIQLPVPQSYGSQVLVTPKSMLLYQHGISVGNTVSAMRNGVVHLLVTNFRNKLVTLKKQLNIGYFESCPTDIITVTAPKEPTGDVTIGKVHLKGTDDEFEESIGRMTFEPAVTVAQKHGLIQLFKNTNAFFPAKIENWDNVRMWNPKLTPVMLSRLKRCLTERTSYAERNFVQQQVEKMIADCSVQPTSSPWSLPVVLVKKKGHGDEPRFCVDFTALNNLNSRPMRPLPRVDDAVGAFGKLRFYTPSDFNSGFWQIRLAEADRQKCAFVTLDGQYEFI